MSNGNVLVLVISPSDRSDLGLQFLTVRRKPKNVQQANSSTFNRLCGGKIEEDDDSPLAAAYREFDEETGLDPRDFAWFDLGSHPKTNRAGETYTVHLFVAFGSQGVLEHHRRECAEVTVHLVSWEWMKEQGEATRQHYNSRHRRWPKGDFLEDHMESLQRTRGDIYDNLFGDRQDLLGLEFTRA